MVCGVWRVEGVHRDSEEKEFEEEEGCHSFSSLL